MKLHFTITLDLDARPQLINQQAKEDYTQVLQNAIAQQNDFAGLTPSYLSEEGVGVDAVSVTHDYNKDAEAVGESFVVRWNIRDVYTQARNSGVSLTESEAKAALARVEHRADHTRGVTWEDLDAAIAWIKRED